MKSKSSQIKIIIGGDSVCSTSDDRFLGVQKRRIDYDKWCEGCGVGYDPGSPYVMDWIKKYAGLYRMAWNNSLCKSCKKYKECGLLVLTNCDHYEDFTQQ